MNEEEGKPHSITNKERNYGIWISFDKHHSNNYFKQELLMNARTNEWKFDEE